MQMERGAGWLGVVLGYMVIWLVFAAAIASVQLLLLYQGIVDMLGIAKSKAVSVALLVAVGAFQFTRMKELCHGVCHSPKLVFLGEVEAGLYGRCSYGAWPWCLLRGLLLGFYGFGVCRGRDELAVDGGCDFIHGPGKIAANRTAGYKADGYFVDLGRRCSRRCRVNL